MSFHIVCDSCTDLTEEDLKKGCYTLVPLTLLVDGEEIIDDETFDQADFLAKVAASKESVKSASLHQRVIWKHIPRQMIYMW